MDKIKKITIKGYRLFKDERAVEFSLPNGEESSGLNIIVGPNNVGKSSLVNLIGGNYFHQINREDWSTDEPEVIIESEGKSLTVKYNKNSINPIVSQSPEGQGPNLLSAYLPSDRRWAFEASNVYLGPGIMSGNPNPTDTELISQFTSVAHSLSGSYASNQNYEDIRKPTEQFISTLLFISQSNTLKEKYRDLVREFIPNYQNYELLRKRGNKYQVLYRSTDTTDYIDMSLVGDGVQTVMVICAYLLLIRESQGVGPGTVSQPLSVLVMDEPETSLHPQAQKRLYGYLKEISKNVQVIYATHSPYLTDWSIIEKNGRIIRIDSKNGKQADIHILSKQLQPRIKFKTQPRRQSNIDTISREIVFTDKILIVEGLDDANILRHFIESENKNYSFEICGHGADGAGNILNWLRVATALGIKCAGIYDNDRQTDYEAAKAAYGDDLIKIWSTDDIRDKAGCPHCASGAKKGLFDDKGVIKQACMHEVDSFLQEIDIALSN